MAGARGACAMVMDGLVVVLCGCVLCCVVLRRRRSRKEDDEWCTTTPAGCPHPHPRLRPCSACGRPCLACLCKVGTIEPHPRCRASQGRGKGAAAPGALYHGLPLWAIMANPSFEVAKTARLPPIVAQGLPGGLSSTSTTFRFQSPASSPRPVRHQSSTTHITSQSAFPSTRLHHTSLLVKYPSSPPSCVAAISSSAIVQVFRKGTCAEAPVVNSTHSQPLYNMSSSTPTQPAGQGRERKGLGKLINRAKTVFKKSDGSRRTSTLPQAGTSQPAATTTAPVVQANVPAETQQTVTVPAT